MKIYTIIGGVLRTVSPKKATRLMLKTQSGASWATPLIAVFCANVNGFVGSAAYRNEELIPEGIFIHNEPLIYQSI